MFEDVLQNSITYCKMCLSTYNKMVSFIER